MAFVDDSLKDAGIDKFIAECDAVHMVNAESTTYATVTANSLATFTPVLSKIDSPLQGGGRAASSAEVTDIEVTTAGEVNFMIYVDSTNSKVLASVNTDPKSYDVGDFSRSPVVVPYGSTDVVVTPLA